MRQALDAVQTHGSIQAAADTLGLSRTTLQHRYTRARTLQAQHGEIGGPPIPEIGRPPEGFAVFENNAQYDADGHLTSQSVRTRRDHGGIYAVPAGHVVKGESTLLSPEGRIVAQWIKTREGAGESLVEALREAFATYDGAAPILPAPGVLEDDLLTLYPLPDLHLGMLSWQPETGADYDIRIATETAQRGIGHLVAQSRPSRRATLLVLGDFFHANDSKNVTPGSGHLLDVDGRWAKVYLAGARLVTALVDIVAAKHQEVEVVVLPGNHDPDSATTLAVALSMFYSANARVQVYMKPGVTWYRRFGRCLLGATHGHTMTADRAAMAMASDRHEDWGQTEHRHIFSGHLHHEKMKEVPGVRVETLTSPAARDAWNAASGYRSQRALTAITFHSADGEIGRHRVTLGN